MTVMLKSLLIPIHPAGWPFIALFAGITFTLGWYLEPLGYVGTLLTAWCAYFFRNPDRMTPTRPGLVVSPADGIVQSIVTVVPPEELGLGDLPLIRVAVFMNVFNVHINRVPIDGVISGKTYRPGKFFNASLDKASVDNERQCIKVKMKDGREIGFVQIAGLVARRIKCWVSEGDMVQAGKRFGLIQFGSRVDIFLPKGVSPLVTAGQTAIAGETVLADLKLEETARAGCIR